MNVSEIVAEWLKANQYDGLVDKKTGCRCNVVDQDRPCDGRFCVDCEPYPSQIPLGGKMTKRTEGPWVVAEDVFNDRPEIRDRDGRLIAVVMAHYPMSATTQSSNAAFIATACNCHEELVAACKEAIELIEIMTDYKGLSTWKMLKAALSKAEGGAR